MTSSVKTFSQVSRDGPTTDRRGLRSARAFETIVTERIEVRQIEYSFHFVIRNGELVFLRQPGADRHRQCGCQRENGSHRAKVSDILFTHLQPVVRKLEHRTVRLVRDRNDLGPRQIRLAE